MSTILRCSYLKQRTGLKSSDTDTLLSCYFWESHWQFSLRVFFFFSISFLFLEIATKYLPVPQSLDVRLPSYPLWLTQCFPILQIFHISVNVVWIILFLTQCLCFPKDGGKRTMGAGGVPPRALLWLNLFGLISLAWPLNPDDPNVCSHWERSVPPPPIFKVE